jgi:hypothetical protein
MQGEAEAVIEGGIRKRPLNAYGFLELQNALEETLWQTDADLAIFDITCLTKIHSLALAASIAAARRQIPWLASYTAPENYSTFGHSSEYGPGWKDIIIAPLSETGLLFNESDGRGIVLPGHEADRLVVALAEIEPSGGLIVVADTKGRPDLRYLTERRNRKIVRQLTRMRASNWTKYVVGVTDLPRMTELVEGEVKLAREHKAPVILFPFGPKPLMFASALELALEYPEASWFAYPMPEAYDARYTEGTSETYWLVPVAASS